MQGYNITNNTKITHKREGGGKREKNNRKHVKEVQGDDYTKFEIMV